MAQYPPSSEAYFSDFDRKLAESQVRLKHFRDIETDLQALNAAAWDHLKVQVAPALTSRHAKRGWQALFDRLNEAKGYKHLIDMGCSDVEFIQISPERGHQTPDLQGALAGAKVLCEVKTINMSDVEATRRKNGAARSITLQLPEGFFNKLLSDLKKASDQMRAYCPDSEGKRLVYVVVNFDDLLHEYAADSSGQLDAFVAANPIPGIDVIFDIKPPFYSASA